VRAGPTEEANGQPQFPIAGIGASAGGLAALKELLEALPADPGLAIVVIQHLDPSHESMLSEILARSAALPVREVRGEQPVEMDHIYVIPPGRGLVLERGRLKLSESRQRSIDQFLQSLASDHGHRAIGVILSGSASDGAHGLQEIKGRGGITFAQDRSAQVDSMPRSAIATGCVDFVLPPADIGRELVRISRHPYVRPAEEHDPLAGERQLLAVLDVVRSTTGVDFSHYKRNTLVRRLARRMVLHGLGSLADYLKLLQDRPTEIDALYQDILINVTSFFRDPEAFELLKSRVFPRLTADRSRHDRSACGSWAARPARRPTRWPSPSPSSRTAGAGSSRSSSSPRTSTRPASRRRAWGSTPGTSRRRSRAPGCGASSSRPTATTASRSRSATRASSRVTTCSARRPSRASTCWPAATCSSTSSRSCSRS
jgi:two-component system CheB/CheR fusion protein